MLQTSVCVVLAYSLAYSLWAAHSFFPVTSSATAAAVTAYGPISLLCFYVVSFWPGLAGVPALFHGSPSRGAETTGERRR